MAIAQKKFKMVYPFDIKEMRKHTVDEEYLERKCGFCFHGSTVMSYVDVKDISRFNELSKEERTSYFAKVFLILFIMYSLTAIAVIATEEVFCIYPHSSKVVQYVIKNVNYVIIFSLLSSIAVSYLLVFIQTFQRAPFSVVFLFLEVLCKSVWLSAWMIKYKTHILIILCITYLIVNLLCFLTQFIRLDYKYYSNLALLACIEIVVSFVVGLATLTLTCKTLDLAVIGTAMLLCMLELLLVIAQIKLIVHGITMELTKYEYIVGAFLVYHPVVNIFLSFMRTYNFYLDAVKLPKATPKPPESKRIYVWNYR